MRKTPLLVATAVAASSLLSCATWRSKLQHGNFNEACHLASELENDRLHRAALMRVSREYTASTSTTTTVTVRDDFQTAEDWRIVTVTGPMNAKLRAVMVDDFVWLPARDEDVRLALALAAGLDLAERPSPVAQKVAESADRKVRRMTAGTVDPTLRKRDFGVVTTCPRDVTDCKARRDTFRNLATMFAGEDCQPGTSCERHFVAQRRYEALGEPSARMRVEWNLDGCAAAHTVDIPLNVPNTSAALAEDWMPVSTPLTACTLDDFAQPACAALADPEAQ